MLSLYLQLVVVVCGMAAIKAQTVPEHDHEHTQEFWLEYEFPNVVAMKFHLLQRRIPELLTKIPLLEMECPIKQCNISLVDIVNAIQLETYDNVNIANAIEKVNITRRDAYNILLIYNLNATYIENLLTRAGITFSEVYKRFMESLQDPVNTIPQILGIVNVSVTNFMNAQAYGNDTTRLEVLSTGNYSYENIESVLTITNKTGIDLLKTFPLNTIAKNLKNFDSCAFRNLVKNLGVTSITLEPFYTYLNVTLINFIAYPGYTQILTDFERYLNPEEVIATFVSKSTLVTSNKGQSLFKFQTENTDFVRNYSYFQAENIQNPLVHFHVKNVLLNNVEYTADDIAVVESYNPYTGNITELATIYNSTKLLNCTYVTQFPYGDIHVEAFPVVNNVKGHTFTLLKTNMTFYNLGSPLFCQNKLVGIATQESENEIKFSTFMKKTNGTVKPPSQQPPSPGKSTTPSPVTGSKPSSGSTNYVNVVSVLLIMASTFLF